MATLDVTSTHEKNLLARWPDRTGLPGVITASLLTVVLVSTLAGGMTGAVVHDIATPAVAAILSGLFGTITAGIVRNTLLVRAWNAVGVDDLGTPPSVLISASVASLAGSLAAYQMLSGIGPISSGVTGMLAGLLSAGLMSLLMLVNSLEPAAGKE